MNFLNCIIFWCSIFAKQVLCGQTYILEETIVSGDVFAGEKFHFHPMLSIYEESTGAIATGFQGDVYAMLISGPTGYEKLIYNGTVGSTTDNAVTFYGGIASLTGLSLNKAGRGYRLRYVARQFLMSGEVIEVAQVDGKPFSVSLNSPHHLDFLVHPGSATGGMLLQPQPILSIVDLGGNLLESVNNEGYVTVELATVYNSTNGAVATLRGTLIVDVVDGKAVFTDLYINEASLKPFFLTFQFHAYTNEYNSLKLYSDTIDSNSFGIGIGEPRMLNILSSPAQGVAFGGSAFEYPPLLELVDAGGNRIVTNSFDYVSASFARNPWGATLLPINYTMQRLDRGIARFTQLAINNAGNLYSLRFKFMKYNDSSPSQYIESDIYQDTEYFTVNVGPPYKLNIQRQPAGAVAGGSALSVQPIVALNDVGGNVVRSDSESLVIAHLVSSPSSAKLIRVDTSEAELVSVTKLYVRDESLHGEVVTIGDRVVINVEFDQEVTIGATSALPKLALDIMNSTSSQHYAIASRRMVGYRSKVLQFVWEIPITLTNVNSLLSHASNKALELPTGCSLLDNLGRSVNMTLPHVNDENGLIKTSNVTVNTYVPQIIAMDLYVERSGQGQLPIALNSSSFASAFTYVVGSNDYKEAVETFNTAISTFSSTTSPPSEWSFSTTNQNQVEVGAGHLVLIELTYDLDVTVTGIPFLLLNITVDNNQTSGTTTSLIGTVNKTNHTVHVPHKLDKVVSATYLCGTGGSKLLFGYEVSQGDKVAGGSFKLVPTTVGSSTNKYAVQISDSYWSSVATPALSPTPSPTKSDSTMVETSIYRKAHVGMLSANLTISLGYQLQSLATHFVIDTSAPVVNFTNGDVRSLSSDGVYRAGDELLFAVNFDKSVVATEDVRLALDTGSSSTAFADLEGGSGTRTLTFIYEVSTGDSTTRLSAWYSSNKLHTALVVGDGSIMRQSTSLTTKVDISMITPRSSRLNETSSIEVDGVVPFIKDTFIHSVIPSSASQIYTKNNVDTEIVLNKNSVENITLGVASEVMINVSWSTAVTLVRGHHKLYLTVGKNTREASYVAGNNTKEIQYKYTVKLGDVVTRSTTTKCLKCYSGEGICRNPDACPWTLGLRYTPNALNGDIRQLSTSPTLSVDKSFLSIKHKDERSGRTYGIPLYGFNDTSKFVFIDTSTASQGDRETYLVGFTTPKSDGVYGAGENIYFIVEFSDQVSISDSANPPRIRLNLENSNPYAVYTSGSGSNKLKFLYRIKPGDNSSALDWSVSPFANINSTWTSSFTSSFFLCNVTSTVNGTSSSTSSAKACGLVNNNNVAVNVTLSASKFNTGVDFPSLTATSLIEVSTMAPLVTRVYSDKNDTSPTDTRYYTVGEAINVIVEFDQPVALFSKPILYLATKGDNSATALTCLGYTPKKWVVGGDDQDDDVRHSDGNVGYGYSLLFEYIVQEGDYSYNLSLASSAAVREVTNGLENNALTLNYKQASIKRDSNFPITDANLSLAHLFDDSRHALLALKGRTIRIDTSHVPRVTNVTWAADMSSYIPAFKDIGRRGAVSNAKAVKFSSDLTSNVYGDGTFRPGDVLVFKITFDVPVTFGPSFTSEGVTKQLVDGGDGVYVSSSNSIDYFVVKPFLWIETGEVDRKAHYLKGDGTNELYFSYEVMPGDVTFDLEYVDAHSFEAGLNASHVPAHIYQISTNPTVIADLTLPLVGRKGSLSYNQNIKIEGATPYISLMSYILVDLDREAASADDATFQDDDALDDGSTLTYASRSGVVATLTTKQVIYFKVSFSEPVVVSGNPRIRMGLDDDDGRYVITDEGGVSESGDQDGDFVHDQSDTDYETGSHGSAYSSSKPNDRGGKGVVVRYANYLNGTNSSEVLFEYVVSTGDMCEGRLDYHADERNFRSSEHSFDLSQGSIHSASFNPILPADIHLNPAGGFLQAASGSIGSVAALAEGAEDRDAKAHLYGTYVAASNGVATFEDLSIAQRGPNYQLNFECLPYDLPYVLKTETSGKDLEVEYSSEFEVSGRDRESGDGFGHSVDVAGDLMIAGAPYKHLDVHEVQYVRTSGDAARDIKEIQIIGIATNVQSEVQSFYTSTSAHDSVSGSFRLSYDDGNGNSGETVDLLHDAPGESVSVALQEALPGMGVFYVEREEYLWCACKQAYKWSVTFVTASGDIQLLSTDGSDLGGDSVISAVSVKQQSPWLSGSFTLGLEGFGGDYHYTNPNGYMFNNQDPTRGPIGGNYSIDFPERAIRTRPVSIDASPSELLYAIETDLGLKVDDISVANEDDRNGRQYIITFSHQYTEKKYYEEGIGNLNTNRSRYDYGLDNNILQLHAFKQKVGGSGPGGSDIWVKTLREGANRLWGSFTLSFREPVGVEYELSKRHGDLPSTTDPIPYNASAAQVAFELERLGSIGSVTVTKDFEVGLDGGALWSITFNSVKRLTNYGWSPDTMDNLEPLVSKFVDLHGTNRRVEVGHRSGGVEDYPHWAPKRLGSFGEQSGVAYVFQRSGITADQYSEVARLSAHDADQYDLFGWSVALSGGGRPWGKEQGTGVTTGFGGINSGHRPIVAVGAPSKDDGGVLEQQLLRCFAEGGYFKLSFRGSVSDWIPSNITHHDFVTSIRSSFGPCLSCHSGATADPMHVFPAIEVEPWEGGLCSYKSINDTSTTSTGALITFLTPSSYDSSGDLEMLVVDGSELEYEGIGGAGNASVIEIRKGTSVTSGPDAKGAQKGAVYMFGSGDDNGFGQAALWRQHAKLVLPDGGEADRFGWAVSLSSDSNTLVVSAPGEGGEVGAIYIYQRNGGLATFSEPQKDANYGPGEWVRTQRLDGSVFSSAALDKFGESMALSPDGNTIVVGAPGYDNNKGAAYILLRNSYSGKFRMHQQLTLDADKLVGVEGDLLGCAVAIDHHTVVVSACGRSDYAIHTGTVPSATKQHASGAVYVYLREFFEDYFFFAEKLEPSNVVAEDRFGYSVAISNDTIIASSLSVVPERSQLIPRHAVHKVTTSALSQANYPKAEHVGATFTLSWRSKLEKAGSDVWVRSESRPIESDATASELASILEKDLNTGFVRVARTPIDADTGGYTWYVTFATSDGDFSGGGVPLLEADGSMLTGSSASVIVTELNPVPAKVRGLVRTFIRPTGAWADTLDGHWKPFVEQAMLFPEVKQRQDLFGFDVALDGEVAAVGAPNRDSFVSFANGGSAFAYDLDFLRLEINEEDPYEVYEGHGQVIPIIRSTHVDTVQVLKLESLDRNMDEGRQARARDLFGLDDASLYNGGGGSGGAHGGADGLFATVADAVGAGSAFARSQYYGSDENKSVWVDGTFDYRGVSDYLPLSDKIVMFTGQTRSESTLNTTNDNIVEQPDENVTVAVRIPGMWASLLGTLSVEIVIIDDADGSGEANGYSCYEKVYASDGELQDKFGDSVVVLGDVALIGAPSASGTKYESGAAYVFRRVAGYWEQETRLQIPHTNVTLNVDDDSDDGGGGYTRGLGGEGASGRGKYGRRAKFGHSVAITHAYRPIYSRHLRPLTTALVGSPGTSEVHVFSHNSTQMRHWRYEGKLTHPEAVYPHHRFGERGSVAIHQDIAVVGAVGLEAIFVFRRVFKPTMGEWKWRRGLKLISSDYDYDLILDKVYMHQMNFGIAVGISSRTIAVGAPLADYGNLGDTNVRETYPTDGVDNYGVGRGKVYIFHSAPHQQTISLRSDTQLYAGTWRVSLYHRNITTVSDECKYDATEAQVKHALEKMDNIDEVEVSYKLLENGLRHRWQVSFISENDDPPLMTPLWQTTTSTASGFEGTLRKAGGCGESVGGCVNMSTVYTGSDQSSQMVVELKESVGDWLEIQDLQAQDKNSGDRFGETLSLNKEALVVGAPHSAALTTTTWDFETGDLIGWTVEGNAFDYQPTYGDNMVSRSVYGEVGDRRSHGGSKRGNIQGRYFIGTYERRPGAGRGGYQQPHPDFPPGTAQGDSPMGTITSEPFSIPDTLKHGEGLHFNIGGGCDATLVYVELLVDGVGVDRATGKCEETMKPKMFDLSLFRGRSAQVRVVDMSSSPWGHINVDSFVFDWAMGGGEVTGRASSDSGYINNETSVDVDGQGVDQKVHRGLPESTPEAGVAYVFRRQRGSEDAEVCDGDERLCVWYQDAKLMASDRRANDRFGSSVAIDDSTGTVVVSALGVSASSNMFGPRIQAANHPYRSGEVTGGVKLPLMSTVASSRMMVAPNAYTPLPTGLSGYLATKQYNSVNNSATKNVINKDFDIREFEKAGAVYVYTRRATVYSGGTGKHKVGRTVEASSWSVSEQMRISVPSLAARDSYGKSVALYQDTVFIGIPGDDGNGRNVGAAAMFDVSIQRCYFKSAEYVVVEGEQPHVVVTIGRDSEWLGRPLTISFATSDLTARGIDPLKYEECMNLPLEQRTDCGDYMQTAGEITFGAKDSEVAFAVFIVNDFCHEHYSEHVLLTMSIPGAQALGGEDYMATIRIDDDDMDKPICA